ncbi:DUF3606 domain-containing protein [Achromobacter spanius]
MSRNWTKELGVTEEQLRAAVKAVGVSASAVRDHLTAQHRGSRT